MNANPSNFGTGTVSETVSEKSKILMANGGELARIVLDFTRFFASFPLSDLQNQSESYLWSQLMHR